MTPNRALSLVHLLVLVLTLMHLAHGKAIKQKRSNANEKTSDNCPIQEECKFPDCVNVHIGSIQKDSESTTKDSPIHLPQDVRNRSTSPWDYRINVDPDRFPSMISEANCRHFNCLDSKRMPVINMNSVAIKQEILVIKRKQTGCRQTYWLEKKLVTVGCTCAMASTYASSG